MYIKSHEEVIKSFVEIHGDTYDYSLVEYTKRRDKVTVICKEHGEFSIAPSHHLRGYGCTRCNEKSNYGYTKEDFVKNAVKVHGDKYDYSNSVYINNSSKINIVCPLHGEFEQKANSHLNGNGCRLCANDKLAANRQRTTESFIEKAKEIHSTLYGYAHVEYVDTSTKVKITCRTHGDFEQKPSDHLQGNGCPHCAIENKGYNRTDYIKKANGRLCTFYKIRCFNEEESFYKIGITMMSTKKRYKGTKEMPYNYEIISEVFGEAGAIWDLELQEKRKLKEFNYQPTLKFKGSKTECFTKIKNN